MIRTPRRRQRGTSMIEVLVALVVSVIGLLGMIALQMRAYAAETESYQRAHASILLEDIANRINANRARAADYVATDLGVGAVEDCSGMPAGPDLDLCIWGNLLRGVAESSDGTLVGTMQLARGCITNPEPDVYVVAIAWQGTTPTAPAATACGEGAYANEDLRRAVTTLIRVARLDG